MMRVLHIVAADRWTGAAATALQLVEALRGAGVDCRFVFRGGDNLELRLRGLDWALPALRKERSLTELRAALALLRELAAGCDVVHVHLPHDHALARLAFRHGGPPIVRSLRRPRHLRRDPFYRWLLRSAAGVALANSAMVAALRRLPPAGRRPIVVLPPVVEPRFVVAPGTPRWESARAEARSTLGVPPDAFVAGAVGKLDRGRGHDLLLRGVAAARGTWALLVGHGRGERALRRLASRLGIAERVTFGGYVDDGLERLYAAMDVLVFPAAGADHGHRAIAEASGCGVPALAADIPGVTDLVGPGVTGDLWPAEDAAALGTLLLRWSADLDLRTRAAAAAASRASSWTPANLANVALGLYESVLRAGSAESAAAG